MSSAVAALVVFTALLWSNAEAFSSNAADCCLSTTGTLVPRQIAAKYFVQNAECSIPATVFITKKGRRLCSPPADDSNHPWVRKLIEYLDQRNAIKKGTQK